MDVECAINSHQKMISARDEQDSILDEELAEADDEYQLTELKNVGADDKEEVLDTSGNIDTLEELTEDTDDLEEGPSDSFPRGIAMSIKIVNAVFHYPSLYDPADPNFNNRTSCQKMWKKVAEMIMWQNDIPSLQQEWRHLKDRYIKHLKSQGGPMDDEYHALWSKMKYLDRILASGRGSSGVETRAQRDFYVDQPQTVGTDVMISGYQTAAPAPSVQSSHRTSSSHTPSTSTTASHPSEIRPQRSSHYHHRQHYIRVPSESHQSTPSSRVTVVPAMRTSSGTAVVQLPPGSYPRNQRVQIIHTPPNSQATGYDHRVNVGDPGVTVTERGTIGRVVHVVKKEPIIVDNGEYYNEQKLYHTSSRVLHSGIHDSSSYSTVPTKRMRIVTRTSNSSSQPNLVTMHPSTSRHISTLADEVIIDDGIIESEVQSDSPLLAESPGIGSVMISGQHPSLSPAAHLGLIQQSQYDADLQLQQRISSYLQRHDDNEKAVQKFYFQRILLEARYGPGSGKNLCQDDDLESGGNGHELSSQ